jgi:hyaluronan synthase
VAILDQAAARTSLDDHSIEPVNPARKHWGAVRVALIAAFPIVVGAAVYLSRVRLPWMIISLYGFVSITRVIVQSFAAAAMRRRQAETTGEPMVSIVVAMLNESPELFAAAMRSLADQRWSRFEVIVIDDGSAEPAPYEAVCRELGFRYAYQANAGKRHALNRGFALLHPDSEYVLTSDSDTVWDSDTIARLVATMDADPSVGAVTGHVDTLNPSDSWLTRLVARRYWLAFEVERAAQGYFGAVTCVSGPLGGYRRDVIDKIKEPFITQVFMGRLCTYGDDRHLTNLVLGLGYRVGYCRARAWTEVPTRLRPYLRQQLRWNRSFWRETIWTVRALPQHGPWLTVDCLLTVLLPFQLAVTVFWFLWMAATIHLAYLLMFFLTVIAMSLLRVIPAIIATRRADFLLLVVFGLFHLAVLLPLRFVALCTVSGGGWGSRATRPADGQAQADQAVEVLAAAEPQPVPESPADHDRRPHRARFHHGERGGAEHQPPHGITFGRQDRREQGPERDGERRPVGLPATHNRPPKQSESAGARRAPLDKSAS